MSNYLSIGAVTATLQLILMNGFSDPTDPLLNGTSVTMLPLDKARQNHTGKQLNLFLYQIQRNAAWVNADMPQQVRPGEHGLPPIPLNLYYLLTPFGPDSDQAAPWDHLILGKAMSVLHDHPVLSAADIKAIEAGPLQGVDVDSQLEHLRITFQPLSIDDFSKLWTGFGSQFRMSAAYEVAVTLIASTRPSRAPLPVLSRGRSDSGITSQSNLIPPFPTLDSITPPNNQPSARLNDIVTLSGFNLDGSNIRVQFTHPLRTTPHEVAPQSATALQLKVQIPSAHPAAWPPGFYNVAVLVQRPGETYRRSTNQLMMALAPAIAIAPSPAAGPDITYTVTTTPHVWPGQRATLMLSDLEIPAVGPPPANPINTLTFSASGLTPGNYWVRLRVDGVDSLLVNRTTVPPTFDASQKVTVT